MHGFAQLFRDVMRDVEGLKSAQLELRQAVPPAGTIDSRTVDDRVASAERELMRLRDFYHDAAHRLKQHPRLEVVEDDVRRPLEEVLQEEVVVRVASWPHWDQLFQNTRSAFIVEPDVGPAARRPIFGPVDDDEDEAGEDSASFPTHSDDFFPAFEETVRDLTDFTRRLIERGVDEWIRAVSPESVVARSTFGEELDRKSLAKEIRQLNLGEKELVGALRAAVKPALLRINIFQHKESDDNAPADSADALPVSMRAAADIFPLARATKDTPGRTFGWSSALRKAPPDFRPEGHLSHQAMAVRLRDEMTRSLLQASKQVLTEGLQVLLDNLTEKLDLLVKKLTVAVSNPLVLQTILNRPETASDFQGPDVLQPIRRLASAPLDLD